MACPSCRSTSERAKLLAETEGAPTRSGMMTLAYASPEQLRGEPVSTLSDVFSLGVLLFELVTGRPAFGADLASRAADFGAHREPLNLPQSLPGDLDRVVRKALAFDPTRRYPSVDQLSEDLRRYLGTREPVTAHAPGLAYRLGKFARRHAVIVGLATAFMFGMAGATVFSMRQARIAQREAARAQAANRFLTTVFRVPFFDSGSRYDMTVQEASRIGGKTRESATRLGPGARR